MICIWEYKVYQLNPIAESLPEVLQGLGDGGWELVTTIPAAPFVNLIFKRPG